MWIGAAGTAKHLALFAATVSLLPLVWRPAHASQLGSILDGAVAAGVVTAQRSLLADCVSDADCAGSPLGPYCNTAAGGCVACLVNAHCSNPTPCCSPAKACSPCSADAHCSGYLAGTKCDADGRCAGSPCINVKNCAECTYRKSGTATKTYCRRCEAGYAVATRGASAGRACWCAPGYYKSGPDACSPCGYNFWCPGASLTEGSGALRVPCGEHKSTTTQTATTARDCVVNPGYGWASDDATVCSSGFYNPGNNFRRCTRCPGSLTTPGPGTSNPMECIAPPGYYYSRGKAVACAKGSYKAAAGNNECEPCPRGFTTAPGQVAKASLDDCAYVRPGFFSVASAAMGAAPAEPCPLNTYRSGEEPYIPGSSTNCTACGAGLGTQMVGATTDTVCLALPGHGYNATSRSASPCPAGAFNPGWNKEPCMACGLGTVMTSGPGAKSAQDCFIPAGHGAQITADGSTLAAAPCPLGTYGRLNSTAGLVEVECSKCPANSATDTTGATSSSQCLVLPGFGYVDGQVQVCAQGTFNPGGNQQPCTACGQGRTTLLEGATSAADCVLDSGWSDGLTPCAEGSYKAASGNGSCAACPSGTTTLAVGATSLAHCNACKPGYGAVAINPSSPSCGICPSGTLSAGGVLGGAACASCTPPALYTGAMVSRRGASSQGLCYPEFATDASTAALEWDYIPMPGAGALTPVNDTATSDTAAACEARCKLTPSCQYFVHNASAAAGARCYVRALGTGAVLFANASQAKILFQARGGRRG